MRAWGLENQIFLTFVFVSLFTGCEAAPGSTDGGGGVAADSNGDAIDASDGASDDGEPDPVDDLVDPSTRFEPLDKQGDDWEACFLLAGTLSLHEWGSFVCHTLAGSVGRDLLLNYDEEGLPEDPFISPEEQDRSFYADLWGLQSIRAEEAWLESRDCRPIRIGVIDSGADYTHPDLAPNIWTNPGEIAGNGIDDDNNGYVDDVHGYDFINSDFRPARHPARQSHHWNHCRG
jgi:subtilisin family serine protease